MLPGQLQGLPRGAERFRKPAAGGIGGGQTIEHVGAVSPTQRVRPLRQFDCLIAVAERLLRTGRPQPSQVFLRLQVVRLDPERRLVLCQRLGVSSQGTQGVGQVTVQPHVVRLDAEAPLKLGHGFVEPIAVGQRDAKIVVGLDAIGQAGQSHLIMRDRLDELPQAGQGIGKIVMYRRVLGIDSQRLPIVYEGFVKPAAGGQADAQVIVRREAVGNDRQGLLIIGDGLGMVASRSRYEP